jgi:hypothetical protein
MLKYTDEFESWWNSLTEDKQDEIDAKVELLQEHGPTLPRPHADSCEFCKPSIRLA